MTEAIAFGANCHIESCQCDQEFLTYPQQNKGQVTNLILNKTKMTNIRALIEKIWWVIPPIIIVFGIPFLFTIAEMVSCSQPISLFFWSYSKNLEFIPGTITEFFPLSAIIIIFFLGFMGIGYYLVRKQPSLLRRIIIVSVLGIIGFFAGLALVAMMCAY
jgi:hypothetical protein